MSKENFVALDNALFDKFTKKLHQSLEKESELSLSKTRELASKSLGFRNYHGLQDYLKQPSKLLPSKTKSASTHATTQGYLIANQDCLSRFSNENMISMASCLIKSDDMWSERALLLFKTVLSLIDLLKIEKNADNLRKYIAFDALFALFQKTDNKQIKELILDYCTNMLPGFDIETHSQTASEQNAYLSIQLVPLIEFLKNVEQQDFLMFSMNWLVSTQDNLTMTLDSFMNLSNIKKRQMKTQDTWDSFFGGNTKDMLAQLMFNENVSMSEAYEDSWLCDNAFVTIMTSKLLTLKYEKLYFSDFLYNVAKIVNTEKKKAYMQLLQNIKHNYESCVQYSAELYQSAMESETETR